MKLSIVLSFYPTLDKDKELKISEIKAYQSIYKMGICLPTKNSV